MCFISGESKLLRKKTAEPYEDLERHEWPPLDLPSAVYKHETRDASILALASIVILLLLFWLLSLLFPQTMSEFWNFLPAFATVLAATITSIAALFTVYQVREYQRRRYMEGTQRIIDILSDNDALGDRYFVYNDLPSPPLDTTSEEYKRAWKVWSQLDGIGVMLHHGLVYEKTIMELYHVVFMRLWHKLWPHIEIEREVAPRYQTYFQWLAERSWDWHELYHPDEVISMYKNVENDEKSDSDESS